MTRDELVDAGAQASAGFWGDPAPDHLDREAAEAIIDAVEPLIRAEERAQMKRELWTMIGAAEDDVRTMLRARVEALPSHGHLGWVMLADVLALLDGGSE